ncbi:MAG: aminodeoxychorismate/anthranilate synthase component II [bacterium]|nr:aminodeoxychorismate/anthranilate synthase component II [bacterium]
MIDAYDSFTHNLVQSFLKIGAPVRVFRCKDVTMDEVEQSIGAYLVLSPGPGVPSTAGILKDVILPFYGKIPILGVCLGMQAINEVFGGVTHRASKPVHGKTSLIEHDGTGVFTGIPSPITVARYHSLEIDNIPADFNIQSIHEDTVMAFHIERKLAAVQFHPESFLTGQGSAMLTNFLEGKS